MSYHLFVSDLWDPQNGNFSHFYQKIAFWCFLLKSVVFDFFLVKKLSTFTFYESHRFETKRLETPKILWWKIACLKLFSVGCKEKKCMHCYYNFAEWNFDRGSIVWPDISKSLLETVTKCWKVSLKGSHSPKYGLNKKKLSLICIYS